MKRNKNIFCNNCKEIGEVIGVIQKETHYYSFFLNTNQWEDFHGDESTESQSFFCTNCGKKLNYKIVESLMED
jgi:hypothetical protein